jgi:hypothetical protein
MRKFLFEYQYLGKTYGLTIDANTLPEAVGRVEALHSGGANLCGEIKATLPGWSLPFGSLFVRVANLFK